MPTLKIANGSAQNPLTIDLSSYVDLTEGSPTDPADPSFTEKVFTRSLLREGATLSLETFHEKELVFELLLNSTSSSALVTLIAQINQVITTPGATLTWQDDGLSQATVYDGISGQLDIQYSYRKSQKFWTRAKLRFFAQPLGRTAGPRAYAAASGVGPLLIISPYNSGGALAIGASTQAGAAGFGGKPQGASSGIFYPGAPSLAGDAPALLAMTYVAGPAAGGSNSMVSLLPDGNYQPQAALQIIGPNTSYGASVPGGVVYLWPNPGSTGFGPFLQFTPGASAVARPLSWAGNHRLFALARASGTWGQLIAMQGPYVNYPTTASIAPGAFNLYDLGTFSFRASETANSTVQFGVAVPSVAGVGSNAALDIAAVYMLPDATTWFLPGASVSALVANPQAIALDGTTDDQAVIQANVAPSPTALGQGFRITRYARGLVPRPDPKNGLPVLAVLAGNSSCASATYPYALLSAQVAVTERARYVLP